MDYSPQISRILQKLALARSADPELKVFGASDHRYMIHAPASIESIEEFESRHSVKLPEAYRQFLLQVGNGGSGYLGSGAGPFYGIYALGAGLDDIPVDQPDGVPAKPCLLSPGMEKTAWTALISSLGLDSELDDTAYDEAIGTLFGGLLPIGSQGCTYLHCLVLNGPFAGRVLNIDQERTQPPAFAYEPDFLAWYERWLDEVISGDLLQQPSWFGYVRGGPEADLLSGFLNSDDARTQQEFLAALLAKRRLTDATLNELIQIGAASATYRSTICQIVCKSDPAKAKPLLLEFLQQDPLIFLQCLQWYAKDRIPEWQEQILSLPPRITDQQTFSFFTYVLEQLPVDRGPYLAPFARSPQASTRTQALYALGKLAHRHQYLACFRDGLDDPDSNVVRTALQALADLKDASLLPYYRRVAERYPEERDYVLANLDHRLKEIGLSRAELLRMNKAP